MTHTQPSNNPIVVAGAGLSGLTAAIYAARAGRTGQQVVLLEQSEQAGGRGISRKNAGWSFNLGAHALYRAGVGREILTDLGVKLKGKTPPVLGAQAFFAGQLYPFLGPWLPMREKLHLPLLLAQLMTLQPQAYRALSTATWLDQWVGNAFSPLRQLMGFLVRVSSYAANHEKLSAEVAIQQLQLALKGNVLYLDGGWQSLVDQLLEIALKEGVDIRLGCGLKALQHAETGWQLQTNQGELSAAGVILALPPQAVHSLLAPWPNLNIHQELADLEPVLAACLDLGLTELPQPQHLAAFGMDEASYFSVHSASATLAPPGSSLLHAMWYLTQAEDSQTVRSRLEKRLDHFQPGWQKSVGPSYYYPHLTVTHALARAGTGRAGLAGRPAVTVSGLPDLYLAGDWVGETGWLADAALASARSAAQQLKGKVHAISLVSV